VKPISRGDLDFETGECVESVASRALVTEDRLRVIQNPWAGNKRKMIGHLFMILDKHNVPHQTVLDLFSGSSMVSVAFKRDGATVIANDLLMFPYYNAIAFVTNHHAQLTPADKAYLLNPEGLDVHGMVGDFYSARFTTNEAKFLDTFQHRVQERFQDLRLVLAYLSVLFHVMKHCYVGGRLNHGQVLADLDHRLAHDRNHGQEMNFKTIDWVEYHENDHRQHRAFNLDAIDLLTQEKPQVDMAYIDPPYGAEQSDYGKMYAFFEDYLSGRRDEVQYDQHNSRFSGKSRAKYNDSFHEMLEAASYIPNLVFSYNSSSWCKIEDIVQAIKSHRSKVEVEAIDYDYNYRDRSKEKSQEYVIIAR